MTGSDLDKIVAEYATKYPPLISVQQAAEIGHVTPATVYDWSSESRLDGIKCKRGGRLRLHRDGYVRFLMTDDEPVMV